MLIAGSYHSVVRFTDYVFTPIDPGSELLGYYHSSASRTEKRLFVQSRAWMIVFRRWNGTESGKGKFTLRLEMCPGV
jgi:hypothetical protein